MNYKVEFYYQNVDGTYPDKAKDEDIVTRQGKTDSTVSVTAADKADKENGKYVYDGDAANVEKGVVAANGSLVLKLYFKLNQASCTVRYLWNGTDEKVAEDKVVPDMTVSQTCTESPIIVDGCTPVSSDSKSVTIVPDSSKNVITFYYYKNVTLTAKSNTLEYNGFEQSVSGFTAAPEGADFSAITVGAKGTDAGVYPAEFADRTVGTVDATGKYIVTKANDGSLTITAKAAFITITANSKTREYNGEALTDNGYTFTEGVLVNGDILHVVVKGSVTDVDEGEVVNKITSYYVTTRDGSRDVTKNYTFEEPVNGTLKITPREITLTSGSDEKIYDGTPLTNSTVTVGAPGFVDGEGATYTVTGSQLDVGSSDNSFTYELNEGTLAENYIIETEEGKLTVTSPEQHIVITANSAEKTYDGTPLTDDGFTYTDFVLAEGDVLEAVVEGSQTDAGSSVNVIKSYRVMRGDEDVTANYIFDDSVDGTLTVTKRKVTLTSGTACKIYDGKYLTCNKVEVGGDGFVEGEGATYDVTGKRKDIGWSYNDFTYKLNDNTKADNYEITVERGFLYVKDQAEKPKTGDSSDLLLLLALMSMSGAGAAGTVYLYRRKREEQE